MWTETAENRLKELNLTKEQIDTLSDDTALGVNIITTVLLQAKEMGIVEIQPWGGFTTGTATIIS